MPGKVKVKIIAGKNLPVMDRSSDTTDAYVELKLGTTAYKTDVCRKSLHPQWNSEWYRFEVDDSELQDEPLQIRLMDHDTYSANDAIGKVYLNLNPLLLPAAGQLVKYGYNSDGANINLDNSKNSVMSGWIPVYDTMHGIRGEVNLIVKVELFSDFNKFRQSSCGVHFYCSPTVPQGFNAKIIHGFVEELIVNDDPEYQWIDKIRTPRASNEARQTLFFKLSGELQRKIGVKALNLGGNAVIGYSQHFDLEGESGIVARGIGTAVTLIKAVEITHSLIETKNDERALNYLKFVGGDKNFRLNSCAHKSILFFPPVIPPLPPCLKLTDRTKTNPKLRHITRHMISSNSNLLHSRSNPSLSDNVHHTSFKRLLKQEDKRGTPGIGISQRIRNLKYSSQSSLSKKMIALKAKLGDTGIGEEIEDTIFHRSNSDSSVMAELLARSVINVHNSLSCILEIQNPEPINEEDTLEKLEPLAKLLSKTVSEPNIPSNDNISTDQHSFSSSDSSNSDDDEENSDQKIDDFDTISNIISNVKMFERNQKQYSIDSNKSSSVVADEEDPTKNVFIFPEINKNDSAIIENTELEELINPDDFLEDNDKLLNDDEIFYGGEKSKFEDSSIIIPPVMIGAQIKPDGLVRTAMQTMLLEKVNIMGTYTPPTSPTHEKFLTVNPKLTRSVTHPSFSDYLGKNDTVLGIPFTAIKSEKIKKQISHPCLTIEDKSVQPTPETNNPDETVQKSKLSIFTNLIRSEKRKFSLFNPKPKIHSKDKKRFSLFFFHTSKNIVEPSSNLTDRTNVDSNDDPCSTTENQQGSCNSINNKLACLTSHRNNTPPPTTTTITTQEDRSSPEPVTKMAHSPGKINVPCIHRRSSDSDLSITPKGNSLTGSDRSGGCTSGQHLMRVNFALRSTLHQDNFDMLEYPFLTMTKFPAGFIVQIGGAVSARSVKLLERITNVEEPESRDTWWSEIRMEIRSHARSLNCNAVLGYTETTSICEDVCVLSAAGTAAIIGYQYAEEMEDCISSLPVIQKSCLNKDIMTTSLDRSNFEKDNKEPKNFENTKTLFESPEHPNNHKHLSPSCIITHLPYDTKNVSVRSVVSKCLLCSKRKVPDVLIATIEPPDGLPSIGRGCFLESFICRPLKDLKGESIAKDISDGLPFLEYELHRLLVNKLKIKGMNAIFGLKIRISIGEKMLMGMGTGTAIYLASLPSPVLPKLVSDRTSDEKKLTDLQKLLQETITKNRETYQLKTIEEIPNSSVLSDNDDSEDELNSIDLIQGNKDCCVLEVDDPQDAEVVNLLMEERPPDGFHVVNTEFVPGLEDLEIVKNLQMFTQIYRAKLQPPFNLNSHFRRLLQSVYFKLRRMVPCALCNLQFRVDLPEPDEIQLCLIGMALGLGKCQKKIKAIKRNADEDLIFKLDEDPISENGGSFLTASSLRYKQKSPLKGRQLSLKQRHIPYKERHGVDITPLSYVPGGKIERYLGNLNFFFIRETTSIREEGGLSGFIHSFITEVLAIVRAHVTALGGNAMVAYFLTECVLHHNLHKNQGQCLINVGGDVVFVSYFKEDT